MKVIERYVCEICGTDYPRPENAIACESTGMPDPMPFLPQAPRAAPAFGEDGVVHAVILEPIIRPSVLEHEWWLATSPLIHMSHNLSSDEGLVPARAFDPRHGIDAFRYACSRADLKIWEDTMRAYGFDESEATSFVRTKVEAARREAAG